MHLHHTHNLSLSLEFLVGLEEGHSGAWRWRSVRWLVLALESEDAVIVGLSLHELLAQHRERKIRGEPLTFHLTTARAQEAVSGQRRS